MRHSEDTSDQTVHISQEIKNNQTIVVKCLHPDVNEKELKEIFAPIGNILSARVMRWPHNHQSRGFAFVNFDNSDSVFKAIKDMNKTKIRDRTVVVEVYRNYRYFPQTLPHRPSKLGRDSRSRDRSPSRERRSESRGRSRSCRRELKDKTRDRSHEESSRCSKTMNNKETPVKIYPGTRLYVTYLGHYNTEDKLRQLFSPFGNITGIELTAEKKSESAHIWFADYKDAETAANTLNAMPNGSRDELTINLIPEESKLHYGMWRVFVDNMDKAIDENTLNVKFKAYGKVLTSKIMLDENGRSEGFGFVNFFDKESADKAVKDDGIKWWGKKIKIELFNLPQRELFNYRLRKLFVKNLSDDFQTKDMLKGLFLPYGTITDAQLLKDKNGNSYGFGSVTFESTSKANRACKKLDDLKLPSGNRIVVWKARHFEKLFECYICFEPLSEEQTIDLNCDHKMCIDCATKWFVQHVSDERTERCKCPEPTCEVLADFEIINHFVEIYNKSKKTENKCTKEEDQAKNTKIPKDSHTNTLSTRETLRSTTSHSVPNTSEQEFDFEPQTKKLKAEPESPEIIIDKQVKKCPKCKSEVEFKDGYDFVVCDHCKRQLCWNCMKPWLPKHICSKF